MKKIVLSLAGVLAATAFAPEASAVPAFARQVGMACYSCHFQHFPLLNAFGRAFKQSGFTMMGAQAKVEGEHLSIPATLNINVLATAGYQSTSNQPAGTPQGSYMTPNGGGELSLFFGGRVSENIGFLSELAFPDNAPSTSAAKLPMLWDVGGSKIGLVVMSNQSPSYSMEILNTGAHNAHRLMGNRGFGGGHMNATSAHSYLGVNGTNGNGVSFIANGEWGLVNIGRYNLSAPAGGAANIGASPSNAMETTYARGVYTFTAGGWDSAIGLQNFSGRQGATVGLVVPVDTRATIIDGQMQGEVGGMPLGLYASYGRAPTSATGNLYNANARVVGAGDRKSFNVAADWGVIPHKATLQLAFRSAKTGAVPTALTGDKDNAIMIGGVYALAQNVELSLTHTSNSGSAYNGAVPVVGKTQTTLLLETLF